MKIYNIIILDASGSMSSLRRASVDGVNETIQTIRSEQRKNKDCEQSISLFAFSSAYPENLHVLLKDSPASSTEELPYGAYEPSGCTPLYDAIGEITTMFRRIVRNGDKVLVTIITDGYENSSVKYTVDDICKIVSQLGEQGWVFAYIGANQDSILESERIGIHNAMNFCADEEGTREMWRKDAMCRSQFMDMVASSSGDDSESVMMHMNRCYFDLGSMDGKSEK